ncbi:trimeric intracellular cation channel family protein [Georgenia subflava]|uniref:Trimeric intracellular cation channel family protein n=1 Tax=Georgenia subflava TaxID=1622177 RepID=A0A6N7EN06_9MICO|nr:trimeric intracellular cation channel family protein [Georgenia subflava]MPV37526.1 trimeric intracellular cation channel family protein [Georgenia subflava]
MAAAEIESVLPELFRGIDLAGVFLNGVLGGIIARRRRFDAVGFALLAIVSALGGGMLRDTLLQAGTPVALTDPYYLGTALAGAAVAFVIRLDGTWWNRFFILADGMVLGCWAATGAAKTLSLGLGVLPAVLLGVTTAVGGGMIRDVAVGQVPAVFGGNTLYATSAIFASGALIAVDAAGEPELGMLAAIVVGAGLSVLARWRNWRLPEHGDWSLRLSPTQLRALTRHRRERGDDVHSLRPRRGEGRRRRRRMPGEPR